MSGTSQPNPEHEGHRHGPGGAHAPVDFGRAFAVGIALNTAFIVIEAIYGIAANSMALLADAGHNLSDVLGLVVAWVAAVLSRRAPSQRYTYGLRSSSILAALFNAVFLLLAVGAIAWEAILRLFNPEPVAGLTVMVVAAIGIVINGITAWMFAGGRKTDLNIQGAYLHMAADAAVSAGVVAAAAVILLTGWLWVDPAVSLVVSAVIVWGTWSLLRDSLSLSLNAVPPGIAPDQVQVFLTGLPSVTGVHDLHIWAMSTTEVALTAHLVRPEADLDDDFLVNTAHELEHRFGIHHVTLQIENGTRECPFAPPHVV
jgi:cobalt-zinc-cadmium efflux system protein